jgi:nucleotide-binding universal stress UspA family protein
VAAPRAPDRRRTPQTACPSSSADRESTEPDGHAGERDAVVSDGGEPRPYARNKRAVMPFRNILVPIDFDETSDRALERAVSLARTLGAQITVLHVYGLPIYNYPDGSYIPSPEVADTVKKGAREQLDAFMAQRRAEGISLTSLLREGRTAPEICAAATEIGADLIVMGTHGRGLLGRTLLGSVAEAVVRQAAIPVMTVRGSA